MSDPLLDDYARGVLIARMAADFPSMVRGSTDMEGLKRALARYILIFEADAREGRIRAPAAT